MALSQHKSIEDAVNMFSRNTAKHLYYYIEEWSLMEYGDGFQVTYVATDEEGDRHTLRVNISEGLVECVGFPGLIAGIDTKGNPVKGDADENASSFYSAVHLLLGAITEWCTAVKMDAHGIVAHLEMQNKVKFSEVEKRGSKNLVRFR